MRLLTLSAFFRSWTQVPDPALPAPTAFRRAVWSQCTTLKMPRKGDAMTGKATDSAGPWFSDTMVRQDSMRTCRNMGCALGRRQLANKVFAVGFGFSRNSVVKQSLSKSLSIVPSDRMNGFSGSKSCSCTKLDSGSWNLVSYLELIFNVGD